jgi:signal transduction histidine kinase/ActR/RegA family two-component response regulator
VTFGISRSHRVVGTLSRLPTLSVDCHTTESLEDLHAINPHVAIAEHTGTSRSEQNMLSRLTRTVPTCQVIAWLPWLETSLVQSARASGAADWLVDHETDVWVLERSICQALGFARSADDLLISERRALALFEHDLTAQILLDQSGVCRRINPAALVLLGVDHQQVVGERFGQLLSRLSYQELDAGVLELPSWVFVHDIRRPSENVRLELRVLRITPGLQHVLMRALPPEMSVPGVDTRVATMNVLSAALGHEINNPLTYVIANLDHVMSGLGEDSDPETRQCVGEALDGARQIAHIVRDLGPLNRQTEEAMVDIVPVLEAAVRRAWNYIRHSARLERHFTEVPLVVGDHSRLCQIFVNLLVNAAQALPEGEAARNEIKLEVKSEGEDVVVSVTDTGPGIPPELHSSIFKPFFTTKPVSQGTGLGLFVCSDILRKLGGRIELESAPGRGACFRVTLRTKELQPLPNTTPDASVSEEAPAKRILVIDDEPAVARVIARILSREHQVEAISDARQALLKVSAGETYDLVFCDLMMPNMTGMAFHDALAKVAPDLAARVIFLSGGTFTREAEEFLARVPNRRLAKPIDPAVLRAAASGVPATEPATRSATPDVHNPTSGPLELRLSFPKSWERLDCVRESAGFFTRATYHDVIAAERVGLVVHELVENAIKYSMPGEEPVCVDVCASPEFFRVTVKNRSNSQLFSDLERALCAVSGNDPAEVYFRALDRCRRAPEGVSGLGLPRLAYEAQVEISAELRQGEALVSAMGRVA